MSGFSQESSEQDGHSQHGENHQTETHHSDAHGEEHSDAHSTDHSDSHSEESGSYNPTPTIMHHIADANELHLFGNVALPLPVIMFNATNKKFMFGMSSQFEPKHGDGTKEVGGYVMSHSRVKSKKNLALAPEVVKAKAAFATWKSENAEILKTDEGKVALKEQKAKLKAVTSKVDKVIDLSITKNVFWMILTAIGLFLLFRAVSKGYKKNRGKAPSGVQGVVEPIIVFIQDEIAKPYLGKKSGKYLPYLITVFFFIWALNLVGLISPFGNPNVSGNIAVTAALTVFTFFIILFSGNKHYWEHILWPPGIPAWVKPILVPVEILGIFTKPFALMIRLFANITAGHILLLSLVSLIFIFGNAGKSLGGSLVGIGISVPFTILIFLIELMVAALQAFIFTLLSAVFIGQAIEEPHH